MKVQRPGPINPAKIYGSYKVDRSGQSTRADGGDQVELSPEAQALRQMAKEAAEPEVRDALVQDLKKRLQNNTYTVDAKSVAKAMVQELSSEKTAKE